MNGNKNPKVVRATRPREGGERLTSTPRQKPSGEPRGGGGGATMISLVLRFQSPEV